MTRRRGRRLVHTGFLRNGPEQNVGGVLLNQLGLSVARTLGKHAGWHARRNRVTSDIREHYVTVQDEGIVVIPDFLRADEFELVRAEYERSRAEGHAAYQVIESGTNFVSEELLVNDHFDRYPALKAHIYDHPFLLAMAEAIMRRSVRYPPLLRLNVRFPTSTDYVDNNSNVLHSDRHYRTMKAFFYLVDVDETNGAYIYAKGSHRLTYARLKHNYEFAIRDAKLRHGQQGSIPTELIDRGLNVVSPEMRLHMGITETSICGKANTLIISDNFGFHRRGDFSSSRQRVNVDIDFNYLESVARPLFPFIRRLPL